MLKIISKEDIRQLNKAAVDILAEEIDRLLKKQGIVTIGIPGGKSIAGIYNLLGNEKRVPWKKVHFFMADERLVPLNHKDSNYRLAKKSFIGKLVQKKYLPICNVHPFILKDKDDYGLSEYNDEIKKFKGFCDIVILGVGEDGHIASLFPNHDSIKNESEHYILVVNSPKAPSKRISISRKMILKSKAAMLLFIGEGKRQAYRTFLNNIPDVDSCPAKLAKQIREVYVFTDFA